MKNFMKNFMKKKYFGSGIVLGLLVSGCQKPPVQNQSQFNTAPVEANVRFVCSQGEDPETQKRLPTNYALINDSKKALIRWESDRFAASGWQKEKRCQEVASRLENAYKNNRLNMITNGTMNGLPVICTALAAGGDCEDLLITLKPEDDGLNIVQQIGEIMNGRSIGDRSDGSAEVSQIYMQLNIKQFAQIPTFQEE